MNDIVHHDYSITFVASPSGKALQFNYTSNASPINFTQNDTWNKTVAELWSVYGKDQVIRQPVYPETAGNYPYRAIFGCFGRIKQEKTSCGFEYDALNFDGEVTEDSDQETDSEIDVEDNPVHEEYSDSYSNTNVRIIHPFNL
ncbi:hypothetical protein AVEN_263303-1 [Araneus ventricosus]|uniref:Uncharacterized protein n=1 Tax=Araneus ventricosus TaxID=182803 RepID=A0A4Y2UEY8_ARAVE|nr:hypothetical protein AVEN_263303-1 [Araneus ventricosus]